MPDVVVAAALVSSLLVATTGEEACQAREPTTLDDRGEATAVHDAPRVGRAARGEAGACR